MAITAEDYRSLSIEERIKLVQDIWDSIEEEAPEFVPSDAQVAEWDRRLAAYEADPTTAKSWEEVRRELFHFKP